MHNRRPASVQVESDAEVGSDGREAVERVHAVGWSLGDGDVYVCADCGVASQAFNGFSEESQGLGWTSGFLCPICLDARAHGKGTPPLPRSCVDSESLPVTESRFEGLVETWHDPHGESEISDRVSLEILLERFLR